MQHMLERQDAQAAGCFLQESLEKYLQAFLLEQGGKMEKPIRVFS